MAMRQKLVAMARLVRPELPAAAGLCVVLGQAIALGALPPLGAALLGFGLGFFLSSSAMVFNDYFDLEVDRVNAPNRPLPAGLLSEREALGLGAVTALLALAIALAIGPLAFGLSLAAWGLGFGYNWKLKSAGLWGNLAVSTNVAMTIVMGAVSVGQVGSALVWIFALICFVFDLAEEIAGDAMDMEGDRLRASRSLAIRYGRGAALRVSSGLFGLVIVLTLLPLGLGERSPAYWLPVAVMDGLVVWFVLRLNRAKTREEGHRAMRAMYLSATLGLLAFLLARF